MAVVAVAVAVAVAAVAAAVLRNSIRPTTCHQGTEHDTNSRQRPRTCREHTRTFL